jgi:hypothetical protein
MMRIRHIDTHHGFILVFLALQLAFWRETTNTIPRMDIVPTPLSSTAFHAISFGDTQFSARIMKFQLSNAGDTFGRSTRLLDYDPKSLIGWFDLLSPLDYKSHILPFLAAYYYGQSKNLTLVRPMAEYLERHTNHDLQHLWWWRVQAIYLAMHVLKDTDLSLKLAEPLAKLEHVPIWVKQYPAFIHEKRGEMDAALTIIENILKDVKNIPPNELTFMRYFVEERIKRLDSINTDASKRLNEINYPPMQPDKK